MEGELENLELAKMKMEDHDAGMARLLHECREQEEVCRKRANQVYQDDLIEARRIMNENYLWDYEQRRDIIREDYLQHKGEIAGRVNAILEGVYEKAETRSFRVYERAVREAEDMIRTAYKEVLRTIKNQMIEEHEEANIIAEARATVTFRESEKLAWKKVGGMEQESLKATRDRLK